jgi:hypothetical protein
MELTGDVWRPLRELVGDPHPEVVIGAAKIADTCLTSLYPDATEIVEAELVRRNSLPDQDRVMDNALRTLLRVRRNVDEVNRRG